MTTEIVTDTLGPPPGRFAILPALARTTARTGHRDQLAGRLEAWRRYVCQPGPDDT